MEHLINVRGIGPAILEKVRSIDSEDPFGLRRIEESLGSIREAISEGDIALRTPTHTSDGILDAGADSTIVFLGYVKLKEYKDWIEDERARSGDDIETIKSRMKDPHLPTGCVLHCYDDSDEDVYVRIDRRVYNKFKAQLERIELNKTVILTVARKSRNSFGASIYVKELFTLQPKE